MVSKEQLKKLQVYSLDMDKLCREMEQQLIERRQ